MKYGVFIQSNTKQITGALASAFSIKYFSSHADKFDVHIMRDEDIPILREKHGQKYLRGGRWHTWHYDFLQSFTPTRFQPPALMQYQGRSVVVDPDVFFLTDVWELLSRDMEGKAILARPVPGEDGQQAWATSVMLLDNAKLKHWDVPRQFAEMFEGKRDYERWITLGYEDPQTIGALEDEWNSFDCLTSKTKALHNTFRRTQPWKAGLPIDFNSNNRLFGLRFTKPFVKICRKFFGEDVLRERYRRHPDPNQENFFLALVREMLEQQVITEQFLQKEMEQNHIRHDILEAVRKAPSISEVIDAIRHHHSKSESPTEN